MRARNPSLREWLDPLGLDAGAEALRRAREGARRALDRPVAGGDARG